MQNFNLLFIITGFSDFDEGGRLILLHQIVQFTYIFPPFQLLKKLCEVPLSKNASSKFNIVGDV